MASQRKGFFIFIFIFLSVLFCMGRVEAGPTITEQRLGNDIVNAFSLLKKISRFGCHINAGNLLRSLRDSDMDGLRHEIWALTNEGALPFPKWELEHAVGLIKWIETTKNRLEELSLIHPDYGIVKNAIPFLDDMLAENQKKVPDLELATWKEKAESERRLCLVKEGMDKFDQEVAGAKRLKEDFLREVQSDYYKTPAELDRLPEKSKEVQRTECITYYLPPLKKHNNVSMHKESEHLTSEVSYSDTIAEGVKKLVIRGYRGSETANKVYQTEARKKPYYIKRKY